MKGSIAALVVLASAAVAQQASFQGLGVPAGADGSTANAVSPDGSFVAGTGLLGFDPTVAYRWSLAGGLLALPALEEAAAISADGTRVLGQAVGVGNTPPLLWIEGLGAVEVCKLPSASGYARGTAMTPDGALLLGSSDSSSGVQAVAQVPPGPVVGFGQVGGWSGSLGNDVSADGAVFVGSLQGAKQSAAFRWTFLGGMQELGTLPGDFESTARGCDATGDVVVGASTQLGQTGQAFVWSVEHGMEPLGVLGGHTISFGECVSADGSLVGGVDISGSDRTASLWSLAEGRRRLIDVLVAQGADLSGWTLTSVRDVSDDGRVLVGEGVNPNGAREGWRATWLWPWADLGQGLPGSDGTPVLGGGGTLIPGSPCSLALAHGRANAPALLVVGFVDAELPLLGGTLVPFPQSTQPVVLGADGEWSLPFTWPPSAVTDLRAWFQVWVVDDRAPQGLSASNGLRGTTP